MMNETSATGPAAAAASPPPSSSSSSSQPSVLLVGGSGYLGQHLLQHMLPLARANQVRV